MEDIKTYQIFDIQLYKSASLTEGIYTAKIFGSGEKVAFYLDKLTIGNTSRASLKVREMTPGKPSGFGVLMWLDGKEPKSPQHIVDAKGLE